MNTSMEILDAFTTKRHSFTPETQRAVTRMLVFDNVRMKTGCNLIISLLGFNISTHALEICGLKYHTCSKKCLNLAITHFCLAFANNRSDSLSVRLLLSALLQPS